MNLSRLSLVTLLSIVTTLIIICLLWLTNNSVTEHELSPPAAIEQDLSSLATAIPVQKITSRPTVTDYGVFTQTIMMPTPNAASIAQAETARAKQSFYSLPGVILAQGSNTTPTRKGLLTYRLEEVVLPAPVTLDPSMFTPPPGKSRTLDRVWRLVITGTNLPAYIGSRAYSVWLDNKFLGGAASNNGTTLTTIVYDFAAFHNGATISVSTLNVYDREMTLPEELALPSSR